jgi:hypothetical protein
MAFQDWAAARAREAITTIDDLEEHRDFFAGDHWRAGAGWIGPQPAPSDTATWAAIARGFVSTNKAREIVQRHAGAVIGKEPAWAFTVARPLQEGEEPTSDEQARIEEAGAAITVLWDVRGLLGALQEATQTLLYGGRACLRLYVPRGLLTHGRIPEGDLAASFGRIYLDTPLPEQATVATDPNTQQQAGIYSYRDVNDDGVATGDRVELVYVDDQGQTIITILGATEPQRADPLDLGGRLTIYAMEATPLITPSIIQHQKLLNLSKTMMGRNVVLGGLIARILFNAQIPESGELSWGGGTTNVFVGTPSIDSQGNVTGYATPGYQREEPVPPDAFVRTSLDAYTSILEEAHQLHALIAGDATASGESRKQARADFEASLRSTITQVERAGRWLLETALAMAAAFSGQPGRYADLRASLSCRVDLGPVSTEEQAQTRENVAAGLLSEETAMGRIGVDDPAAEKMRVALDRAAAIERARAIQVVTPNAMQPANEGDEDAE